jgi:glycosyltransferase involved in cell wall biosynthesis
MTSGLNKFKTAKPGQSKRKAWKTVPSDEKDYLGGSRVSVAVIILTFNEEDNITRALDSVCGWAQEVFVVDSFSTDRTVDIALGRSADGVRVVQHGFENYGDQWSWALRHLPIGAQWTMKLDGDEQVTEDLKKEIAAVLDLEDPALEGMLVRFHLVFMGTLLKWGGLADTYLLRLWRTGKAKFGDRSVNEHANVQGMTVALSSRFLHHDFKSLSAWIERHNRYASLEARSMLAGDVTGTVKPRLLGSPVERRMWLRNVYHRLVGGPALYFLYRFIFRLGFLDGLAGFRFAFLHASFIYWIELKTRETRTTGRPPSVTWPARGTPHPVVASSQLQLAVDRDRSDAAA